MPIARSKQIILSQTSYYHCISRCVRRAFLCGYDKLTGNNFEHRRDWFEKRLSKLSSAFSINVCAYAIMHNHNHLVLHVDTERAQTWSNIEVIQRWHSIHPNKTITAMYIDPQQKEKLTQIQLSTIHKITKIYRERLTSISYFMKALNQYIALRANKEDNCSGRFWESRFKSQALLDERAIISCMVYVDLNPIRAGIATTLENSHYTSIKRRLACLKIGKQPTELKCLKTPLNNGLNVINIELICYTNLLRQTATRLKNAQIIDAQSMRIKSSILDQFGIKEDNWLILTSHIEEEFSYVIGSVTYMEEYRKKLCQKKLKGISTALRLFQ
ncbi:MAG: putative transposase [Glaciecola sp.]|jgi:putative transposase